MNFVKSFHIAISHQSIAISQEPTSQAGGAAVPELLCLRWTRLEPIWMRKDKEERKGRRARAPGRRLCAPQNRYPRNVGPGGAMFLGNDRPGCVVCGLISRLM